MNFDELQVLQNEADFLRQSARLLGEAFGRELPVIESAIKEKVQLRLATGNFSRPEFTIRHGSLVMGRQVCLSVSAPDTPANAYIQTLRSTITCDVASKQWLIWLEDTDESDRGPSARIRKDVLSLLLRISPLPYGPTRYLWWESPSDNAKVVDAVIDTLLGINGPSEFSFDLEAREAPKGHLLSPLLIKVSLWAAAIILPLILVQELWGAVSRNTLESLAAVYWVALMGTAGWQIGRYKGLSSFELFGSMLLCIIIPVWGLLGLAWEPKREPKQVKPNSDAGL